MPSPCGRRPPAVHGDGDPLEEYDFSGTATPTAFIAQSRSHVIQHGLWSAHRYIELDPHDGGLDGRKTWRLGGNRNDSVRIFYGTRPMWRSEDTYVIRMRGRDNEDDAPEGPRWHVAHSELEETDEPCTSLPVEDVTGSGGTTLFIRYFGGGNRTTWTELVHLTGKDPASAKARSILRDPEPRFVDVDGDGAFEAVVAMYAYDYVCEFLSRGHPHRLVLRWSNEHRAYRVAGPTAFAQAVHEGAAPDAIATRLEDRWKQIAGGSHHIAKNAVAQESLLALDLHTLLSLGLLERARALHDSVTLPVYGTEAKAPMTKAEWWTRFVGATRKDRSFEERCAVTPGLAELR